ncbi:MAG: hypothetical protein KDC72_09160, partial [Bacteroidetes bacterium]|nr:hypothetical protein [Bacteroidota bacterium]
MKTVSFSINNKVRFQEKLLHYFSEYKNVFFFNSNNSNANFFGVSNTDNVAENNWKLGFIAYDYKNQIEELTSNHIDEIGFEDEFFFTPNTLFIISYNKLEIQYNSHIYAEESIQNVYNNIIAFEIDVSKNNNPIAVPRISKQQYLNNVVKLKNHIQLGDIYEVNYCQEFY